ncbi:oligosaccharide flippase family protein [Acinetobacter nectaris]|uniref:oligosaccharide flippase family protein n=1 Tax=Acinetobacter nectaris TaxID=1219382 RepID=UPI001F02F66D|nr:oligosaccharide flippase family protein [Acinetobacter nectaris]MCF9000134.1 oligosaccharide flippase family protein [Acinetobacter nectaris]MCF9027058.1 oligosaccharide flippase family protein [Acinetobacter nectaris]
MKVLITKILNNPRIKNSIWMILEKVISIFGLIFVTSFVAKYIGPESFGKLSFATTLFALVQSIAIWGTDVICSKRIAQRHDSGVKLLSAITVLRAILFIFGCIPIVFIMYGHDNLSVIFAIAVGLATFIAVQDIYTIYNDAMLKAIYNVFANITGLVISLIVRFIIAFYKLDPVYLAIPIVLVALIPFLIKRKIFNKNVIVENTNIKINKWRYTKYIFFSGLTIVISAISIAIYTNMTQVMLGTLSTKSDLGVYAVAFTLGSSWSFVNIAVLTSFTPKLYQSDSTYSASETTALVSRVMIFLGFIYLIIFLIFGNYLIQFLYGDKYILAYKITPILIIATLLSNLGQVYARYMFLYNGFKYLMYKTIVIVVFGLILGWYLVSFWGIWGASYNVLIIEFISLTILNYFFNSADILKAQKHIFGAKRVKKD